MAGRRLALSININVRVDQSATPGPRHDSAALIRRCPRVAPSSIELEIVRPPRSGISAEIAGQRLKECQRWLPGLRWTTSAPAIRRSPTSSRFTRRHPRSTRSLSASMLDDPKTLPSSRRDRHGGRISSAASSPGHGNRGPWADAAQPGLRAGLRLHRLADASAEALPDRRLAEPGKNGTHLTSSAGTAKTSCCSPSRSPTSTGLRYRALLEPSTARLAPRPKGGCAAISITGSGRRPAPLRPQRQLLRPRQPQHSVPDRRRTHRLQTLEGRKIDQPCSERSDTASTRRARSTTAAPKSN